MAQADQAKTVSHPLVIAASALGTLFEWYDFYLYGTLAVVIGRLFFPAGNPSISLLVTLATFGIGFGMRPLGAALFGILGDRFGRKATFIATVTLMGGATAAIGLLPTYAEWGMAAPITLLALRVLQGLALGGEYGGAAVYVAEHAPANRRGFYTSFIQAAAVGGFLLSLGVVLAVSLWLGEAEWQRWGWRLPFLFSLVLLAVSLLIRLKLDESPVFCALRAQGEVARHPLRESFDSWAKVRRIVAVLFGLCAGFTTIFYTSLFSALTFAENALHIDETSARLIVAGGATASLGAFVLAGWLSDRIGRKPLLVGGYALALLLIFPLFHGMLRAGNPGLAASVVQAPVTVVGSDCRFDPFAAKGQATPCGRVLDALSRRGVPYTTKPGRPGAPPMVLIGLRRIATDEVSIDRWLKAVGYRLERRTPTMAQSVRVGLAVFGLGVLAAMVYGPLAAMLVEMFPARVRYTSLSLPYHIGAGYFGGFLPFISQYIVAKTGDPFAGLWYVMAVVLVGLLVTAFGLPETAGRDLD